MFIFPNSIHPYCKSLFYDLYWYFQAQFEIHFSRNFPDCILFASDHLSVFPLQHTQIWYLQLLIYSLPYKYCYVCVYIYVQHTFSSYKLILDVTNLIFVEDVLNNYNTGFGIQKLLKDIVTKILKSQNTQESSYFLNILIYYSWKLCHPISHVEINPQYWDEGRFRMAVRVELLWTKFKKRKENCKERYRAGDVSQW